MTLVPGSQFTHFTYNPSLVGNGLYIAILSVCLLAQVVQGVRYRTWDFTAPMLAGILLELMGYTARIFMNKDRSSREAFLLDNITLILGPAFLAASIYLCMGHLVKVYGEHLSALKSRTYLLIFVACDLLNLILQGMGGGICSTQQQPKGIQAGINIVIAGLATQVASLFIFILCCLHFANNVRRQSSKKLSDCEHVRQSRSFRAFLFGIGLATLCIFIRSVFRIVELRQGFTGPLANSEVHFMVLEGAMILIATGALTVFHPGRCFQGHWKILAIEKDEEPGYDSDGSRVSDQPRTSGAAVKECSTISAQEIKAQTQHSVAEVVLTPMASPK
ncbi:hypothetical protein LTR84_008364 [Exophiala bonariae]|uniref:RTA1-domain-containing protein n=1 Tax=Exophiala bonariae TaxID=1690606 RepID=A0AAV9MWX4_9EURO|nr:hypothetical protein LTR84_008364 [Exophiala bonariae]